jgi:hypothetical protein
MTPSDKVQAAGWIRERLHGFAQDVGSVVPPGFEAYARIFHPAWASHDVEVRWSEVAAASGRTVHNEMQFHRIAAPVPGRENAFGKVWSGEPRLGVLARGQAGALIPPLSGHTSTPDRVWFCLWEGYGYLTGASALIVSTFWKEGEPRTPPPPPPPRPNLPKVRVRLPSRDYVLFTGQVAQAEGWQDGPNLWWPDDRAWCVASEIDFPYTYVGGSTELIEVILSNPEIEALPATIHDGITADSDIVNS